MTRASLPSPPGPRRQVASDFHGGAPQSAARSSGLSAVDRWSRPLASIRSCLESPKCPRAPSSRTATCRPRSSSGSRRSSPASSPMCGRTSGERAWSSRIKMCLGRPYTQPGSIVATTSWAACPNRPTRSPKLLIDTQLLKVEPAARRRAGASKMLLDKPCDVQFGLVDRAQAHGERIEV
jgi:hypothetical protein